MISTVFLVLSLASPVRAVEPRTSDVWLDAAAFQERAAGLEVPDIPAAKNVRTLAAAEPAKPSPAPELPAGFTITERFFSLTDSFVMKDASGKKLGSIREKLISLTKSFEYTDGEGKLQAKARARFFALGSVVDVTDAHGRPVGTIREDILKSLFKVYTHYRILGPEEQVLATSEKVEWLSTEIVLRGPDGRPVAEVRRGFGANLLRLTDKWEVRLLDAKAVDPRLIVVIAAYKSSVDNDRRKQDQRSRDDQRRK